MKRWQVVGVFVLGVLAFSAGAFGDLVDNRVHQFVYPVQTTSGVGTLESVTGLSVTEYGDGNWHKTVFTFTNMAVALTDEAGVVAYGGKKLYTFPEGFLQIRGVVLAGALTKSSAGVNVDWDGDVGVGEVTASNNATLASTEQNLIPTTATPQAAAGATTCNGVSTSTEEADLDGHTTAKPVYLNFLVDDADHDVTGTACNLIVNGSLTIFWIKKGDY